MLNRQDRKANTQIGSAACQMLPVSRQLLAGKASTLQIKRNFRCKVPTFPVQIAFSRFELHCLRCLAAHEVPLWASLPPNQSELLWYLFRLWRPQIFAPLHHLAIAAAVSSRHSGSLVHEFHLFWRLTWMSRLRVTTAVGIADQRGRVSWLELNACE